MHRRHPLSVAGTLIKPFLGELDGVWVDLGNLFNALLVGVVRGQGQHLARVERKALGVTGAW